MRRKGSWGQNFENHWAPLRQKPGLRSQPVLLWIQSPFLISFMILSKLRKCFLGFPGGLDSKESAWNAGDPGSVLEMGRSPGGGHGNPLAVLLPGESPAQRSLAGYSLQDQKELTQLKRCSTHACQLLKLSFHFFIWNKRMILWILWLFNQKFM